MRAMGAIGVMLTVLLAALVLVDARQALSVSSRLSSKLTALQQLATASQAVEALANMNEDQLLQACPPDNQNPACSPTGPDGELSSQWVQSVLKSEPVLTPADSYRSKPKRRRPSYTGKDDFGRRGRGRKGGDSSKLRAQVKKELAAQKKQSEELADLNKQLKKVIAGKAAGGGKSDGKDKKQSKKDNKSDKKKGKKKGKQDKKKSDREINELMTAGLGMSSAPPGVGLDSDFDRQLEKIAKSGDVDDAGPGDHGDPCHPHDTGCHASRSPDTVVFRDGPTAFGTDSNGNTGSWKMPNPCASKDPCHAAHGGGESDGDKLRRHYRRMLERARKAKKEKEMKRRQRKAREAKRKANRRREQAAKLRSQLDKQMKHKQHIDQMTSALKNKIQNLSSLKRMLKTRLHFTKQAMNQANKGTPDVGDGASTNPDALVGILKAQQHAQLKLLKQGHIAGEKMIEGHVKNMRKTHKQMQQ